MSLATSKPWRNMNVCLGSLVLAMSTAAELNDDGYEAGKKVFLSKGVISGGPIRQLSCGNWKMERQ